ncbi:hypothetical protein [Pasteuria penetrans]|uniref:hypothetical protein n=1 Tax=Pasteuria penetrans TaxID=86005 RepID=UPI0011EDFB6C|nr:hypothetical protein [Pasteuria penetrans]
MRIMPLVQARIRTRALPLPPLILIPPLQPLVTRRGRIRGLPPNLLLGLPLEVMAGLLEVLVGLLEVLVGPLVVPVVLVVLAGLPPLRIQRRKSIPKSLICRPGSCWGFVLRKAFHWDSWRHPLVTGLVDEGGRFTSRQGGVRGSPPLIRTPLIFCLC